MANLVRSEMIPQIEMETAISNIDLNPIDVVEKLGKYEFIWDFSNKSCSGGFAGGVFCFGKEFSKGDVIDVVRFETPIVFGGTPIRYAIIKINNNEESSIPKDYLKKVDDSVNATTNTGINFGANMNPMPKPVYNMPDVKIPLKPISITTTPVEVKPYVKPKPYLVIQSFDLNNTWYVGGKEMGVQKIPVTKGSVVFLPQEVMSDQYDLALKQGKLQEIPIVSVVSLVDKQIGKCNPSLSQMQQMDYNPCRTVKKGEKLIGYIANGVFTNTDNNVMKPQLSIGEYELIQTNSDSGVQTNSGIVVPVSNDNNNLLLIAGAVILGYALFSNDESE